METLTHDQFQDLKKEFVDFKKSPRIKASIATPITAKSKPDLFLIF